jgi:hypothetical protein
MAALQCKCPLLSVIAVCLDAVSSKLSFEVLTAVVVKGSVFWDITPYTPLKVNRRFGGIRRLQLHDQRISQTRNQC